MIDIIMNLLPSPIESLPYELRKSVVSLIAAGHPAWPLKGWNDRKNIIRDLSAVTRMSKDWAEFGEYELYKIIYISNAESLKCLAYLHPEDRRLGHVKELSIEMKALTSTDIVHIHLLFTRLSNLSSISIYSNYAVWNGVRAALVHLESLKFCQFELTRSIIPNVPNPWEDDYYGEGCDDDDCDGDCGGRREVEEAGVVTIADIPNLINLEKIIYVSNSKMRDDMRNFFGPVRRPTLKGLRLRKLASSEISFLFPLFASLTTLRIKQCNQKGFLSVLPPNLTKLLLHYPGGILSEDLTALQEETIPKLKHLNIYGFFSSDLHLLPKYIRELELRSPNNANTLASALEKLEISEFCNLKVLAVGPMNYGGRGRGTKIPESDWARIESECRRLEIEFKRI